METSTGPQTVLRIKRRRTEDPVPFLRLEGVLSSSTTNRNAAPTTTTNTETTTEEEANYQRKRRYGGGEQGGSSSLDYHSKLTNAGSAVVWKRVHEQQFNGNHSSSSSMSNCRVINAVLGTDTMMDDERHNVDDDNEDHHRPSKKRRKLTVLDTVPPSSYPLSSTTSNPTPSFNNNKKTTKKKKSKGIPIRVLDPVERMVDDSLQEVLTGSKSIQDHYQMITTNPAILNYSSSASLSTRKNQSASNSTTTAAMMMTMMTPIQRWFCWVHSSGGTILHCCALWDDDTMVRTILSTTSATTASPSSDIELSMAAAAAAPSHVQLQQQHEQQYQQSAFVRQMTESLDGDGRTPYEIAELSGHDRVCTALTEFGGDTSNYIYDVFYHLPSTTVSKTTGSNASSNNDAKDDAMVDGENMQNGNHPSSNYGTTEGGTEKLDPIESSTAVNNNSTDEDYSWLDMDNDMVTTAYLTSGVGYWTPEGELVLEPEMGMRRNRMVGMDGENDYYDDDIDSNCEDYDANDYPDEEEDYDDVDNDAAGYPYGYNGGHYDGYDDMDHGGDTNRRSTNMRVSGRVPFDQYQGGDCEYEYDWEQDLGAVYGSGGKGYDDENEDYHYYAHDDYDDDDEE